MPRCFRVGLTGGMAVGKSALLSLFAKLGAKTLSLDTMNQKVLGEPLVMDYLRAVCGDKVLKEGAVDKEYLRTIVLNDPKGRRALESFLHPLLAIRMLDALEAIEDAPYAVVEVPLLEEAGWKPYFHSVLVLTASMQRERLRARGLSEENIDAWLSLQMRDEDRETLGVTIIESTDQTSLRKSAKALDAHYREEAARFHASFR